ncbi:MAG: hypothetical protein KUL81_10675 [Azonexus sp.]|nr:hypothetical protein [Azonexus sp.]
MIEDPHCANPVASTKKTGRHRCRSSLEPMAIPGQAGSIPKPSWRKEFAAQNS